MNVRVGKWRVMERGVNVRVGKWRGSDGGDVVSKTGGSGREREES